MKKNLPISWWGDSLHLQMSLNLQAGSSKGSPGNFGTDHKGSDQISNVIPGMSEILQAHQIVHKMME